MRQAKKRKGKRTEKKTQLHQKRDRYGKRKKSYFS